MLQQTRASVVVPYFEKWLNKFPTIASLASASIDDVIKIWEGLGYYSRARNLHLGANYIVQNHQGEIPSDREALEKIKGLGPYTVGAILSFAFKQKVTAIDGNAIRVLSRYFLIQDDIAKPKTVSMIKQIADTMIPDIEPWVFNEALIELGATICNKNPKCYECPIHTTCKAYQVGEENNFPYKSKKQKIEKLHRIVLVIFANNKVLIKKVQSGRIMSDLHEFPYVPAKDEEFSRDQLIKNAVNEWQFNLKFVKELPEVKHSFTRYQAHLIPILLKSKDNKNIPDYMWVSLEQAKNLPFSSGHRRILQSLEKELQ